MAAIRRGAGGGGAYWAAWHLWMAGVAVLAGNDEAPGSVEATCERALGLARDRQMPRAVIWSCLELCQHLRSWGRNVEADLRVCEALTEAEAHGEPGLVDAVLQLSLIHI